VGGLFGGFATSLIGLAGGLVEGGLIEGPSALADWW
jgi:hypothetical protein